MWKVSANVYVTVLLYQPSAKIILDIRHHTKDRSTISTNFITIPFAFKPLSHSRQLRLCLLCVDLSDSRGYLPSLQFAVLRSLCLPAAFDDEFWIQLSLESMLEAMDVYRRYGKCSSEFALPIETAECVRMNLHEWLPTVLLQLPWSELAVLEYQLSHELIFHSFQRFRKLMS